MSKTNILLSFVAALGIFALGGCNSSQKVTYLQDLVPGQEQPVTGVSEITARPGDMISIIVSCPDPQASALFTLVSPQLRLTAGERGAINQEQLASNYTVDSKGNIDFPVLGEVHIGGLTREQIASTIKNLLVSKELVKKPVVVANFTNLHYSVTGEVKSPGQYPIYNKRVTLLEALSSAGDLTIYGRRDNVKVIREENGLRKTYEVDLRSKDLFDSPVYYMQQNDVIYVEPNARRAGDSSVNENNWKSVSLWISIGSFLMSAAVLIFK